jgi:hypothetical protein
MDQDAELFATSEDFTQVRRCSGRNFTPDPVSDEQSIKKGDSAH